MLEKVEASCAPTCCNERRVDWQVRWQGGAAAVGANLTSVRFFMVEVVMHDVLTGAVMHCLKVNGRDSVKFFHCLR